jgi:hypothetical protein
VVAGFSTLGVAGVCWAVAAAANPRKSVRVERTARVRARAMGTFWRLIAVRVRLKG